MDKITKKYSLVPAKNPLTREVLTRPVLAEQQTRSMTNVIEFAIKNNYMTSQVENLTGAVKGFFGVSLALPPHNAAGVEFVSLAPRKWRRGRGLYEMRQETAQ